LDYGKKTSQGIWQQEEGLASPNSHGPTVEQHTKDMKRLHFAILKETTSSMDNTIESGLTAFIWEWWTIGVACFLDRSGVSLVLFGLLASFKYLKHLSASPLPRIFVATLKANCQNTPPCTEYTKCQSAHLMPVFCQHGHSLPKMGPV